MFQVQWWVTQLKEKLLHEFESRVVFLGLQGSYRRGEATPESDVDIMLVLDTLSLSDLQRYRAILSSMPDGDRACGFLCAKEDLAVWPKYELFGLLQETDPLYGELFPLLPQITREDIADSVRIGAANLYHAVCHSYLYNPPGHTAESLPGFFKAAVFPLKLLCYLETGLYLATKAQLSSHLTGDDKLLLSLVSQPAPFSTQPKIDEAVSLLMRWCQGALRRASHKNI